MARYCHRCGQTTGHDWAYCRQCGARLDVEVSEPYDPHQQPSGRRGFVRLVAAGVFSILLVGASTALLLNQRRPSAPEPLVSPTSSIPATTEADVNTTRQLATPSGSFADLYETQRNGVIRVDVLSCDEGGIGSGFLIADDMVATAGHVVDEAVTIGLTVDIATTTGTVVGIDGIRDLALVRANRPFTGSHIFQFATRGPRVGQPVAALGYPLGNPLTFTQGTVSAVDRTLETVEGREMQGLIQTDAALNPGNSGGPLIDVEGHVLGVIVLKDPDAEGIAYALGPDMATPLLSGWRGNPSPPPASRCDRPHGPTGTERIEPPAEDDVARGIALTLANYFTGINRGDYQLAWEQLSPAAQERNPYEEFAPETSTSYDFDFAIHAVVVVDFDTVTVHLTFTSIQAPGYGPEGEECTHWSLDYAMRRFGSRWLIDRASPHEGDGHERC